jgi:NADH dehydrogenase FAD-containing subunit
VTHAALRLAAKRKHDPGVELTLVDRHHYHQVLTGLPPVAAGTRPSMRSASRSTVS